jgi:NAD(P)H-hydrate epimerase
MRVLNARQMREADRRTIEDIGIPSVVLMENAGRRVVDAIAAAFDTLDEMRVAVMCGRGNNGGDGFVVARILSEQGVDVGVYLVGDAPEVTGDARTNLDILGRLGVDVVAVAEAGAWKLHGTDVLGSDLVVDALFGTGLSRPLTGVFETIVAAINLSPVPVVAIDLPSGLLADQVDVPGPAINASLTVTLGSPKLPLVLPPAETRAGALVVADIGIPQQVIDDLDGPKVEVLTETRMRVHVEPRADDSHKGDYGRVVIVGGSRGKTGAAALAGMGALRSGAGLVTVATAASCLDTVAALGAEYMTESLEEAAGGGIDQAAVARVLDLRADVVAVGPGLGRSEPTGRFVRALVEEVRVPLVIDADGLYGLADDPACLGGREARQTVITPHPGEMARLSNLPVRDVQANRLEVAREFASTHHVHVVLKGHRTILATPDGRTFINPTGNPGMATGGSGDVLAGMIAAWCGQLRDAETATQLAVYLHGLAGDLASADEGEVAMVAGDLVGRLGDAVEQLAGRHRTTDDS